MEIIYTKDELMAILKERVDECECSCVITKDGVIKVAQLVNKSMPGYLPVQDDLIRTLWLSHTKNGCVMGNRLLMAASLLWSVRVVTFRRLTQAECAKQFHVSSGGMKKWIKFFNSGDNSNQIIKSVTKEAKEYPTVNGWRN